MKKRKRIIKISILSFFGFLVLVITVIGIILYGRISSMISVKHKGDGLYTMKYKQNYHLDKALKSEIKDEEDLFDFICDEMFFGYKIDSNISKYGCSAFATIAPDGKHLVGRNFDLKGTDTLCLYTNPKKGYKSISTVSTDMLGVGGSNEISATDFKGRIALLASPYICVDGMNEKGLAVSLLDTDAGETHMDTGKPDLLITLAVRLLLDRAKTVDEAINLLKDYDIHTSHGWTQHIFISDRSGNTAIAEWDRGDFNVVNYNVCTNFTMSAWWLQGNYSMQCDRFDFLDNSLKEKQTNTVEESFKLLEGANQSNTEWSIVYNLTDFTADYVLDKNYDKVYHINPKKI